MAVDVRTRRAEALPEVGSQVVDGGIGDGLLVEPDQARLAALLEQPGKVVGGHDALGAADAMKVAAGTAVDEQAPRHGHLDDRHAVRCGVREHQAFDGRRERRFDRVGAKVANDPFGFVERLDRDACNLARLVLYAQYQDAAMRVRKC